MVRIARVADQLSKDLMFHVFLTSFQIVQVGQPQILHLAPLELLLDPLTVILKERLEPSQLALGQLDGERRCSRASHQSQRHNLPAHLIELGAPPGR